jgi:hypothetical protein
MFAFLQAFMNSKGYLFILVFISFVVVNLVWGPGCANMFPPEGGKRDSLPPELLRAIPLDSSKQFNENEISFTFDEFVQIQDIYQNLIISPIQKTFPNVEARLRTITVKLKDSLEPNTTYTLNFGNAIRDINESNILKNFTYIFSTGSTFDSLTLGGNVVLAENGKIDTTLIVMLHKNPADSAIVNEKPRYVTRVDGSGRFQFRNLPAGTFYIYALRDESKTYQYTSKSVFAFADEPVEIQAVNEPITLYAYGGQPANPFQNFVLPPRTAGADKRLRLQTNVPAGVLDLLNDFVLAFEQPLKKLDTTKISFYSDSAFQPIISKQIIIDSSRKKITLHYNWKENTLYHVVVDKEFAEDSGGRKLLKTDTLSFKTKKLSEYGSLRIRFKNLDLSKNPVLLFIQNENVIKSEPLHSADISLPLFLPGDYELRILQDRNKNGKWDPGQFFGKHIQPEIVTPVTSRPRITIKGNWQNEFDIAL